MKATRLDLDGLRFAHNVMAYNLRGSGASTVILERLIDEAEQSTAGGDAIEELRAIEQHIRDAGVVLPVEDNPDPGDQSLALVLDLIVGRIEALLAIKAEVQASWPKYTELP